MKRAEGVRFTGRERTAGTDENSAVAAAMLAGKRKPVASGAHRRLTGVSGPIRRSVRCENPVRHVDRGHLGNHRFVTQVARPQPARSQPGAGNRISTFAVDGERYDAFGGKGLAVRLLLHFLTAAEGATERLGGCIVTHRRPASATGEITRCLTGVHMPIDFEIDLRHFRTAVGAEQIFLIDERLADHALAFRFADVVQFIHWLRTPPPESAR